MPRKKLIPEDASPRKGGGIAALMQRFAAAHTGVMPASDVIKKCRYIDFVDPKTGLPCIALEHLFGSRGLLCGRNLQVRAVTGAGKSSLMHLFYAMAQKTQEAAYCLHVESEGAAAPPDRLAAIGANPDELLMSETQSLDDALALLDSFVCEVRGGFGGGVGANGTVTKTKYTDPIDTDLSHPIVMGVDSISALGKAAAAAQDVIDTAKGVQIGYAAVKLREFFRERAARYWQQNALLMLASQATVKLETGLAAKFAAFSGPKTTSYAQDAIGFACTYCVDLKPKEWKPDGVAIGTEIDMKVFKNKWNAPGNRISLFLTFENGYDLVHTDAEYLLSIRDVNCPFCPANGIFTESQAPKRNSHGISCPALSDKTFRSEEEFVRAFYANADMVDTIREKTRVRGWGHDWETRYASSGQIDQNGNMKGPEPESYDGEEAPDEPFRDEDPDDSLFGPEEP